ncbi:unnamed protein product [Didymodactylos carnosus]|uniref:F-box domain-containing protein n=1 Tax=Didymodactylos carnosus TaxID=1234261 RepID=A0A8S2CMN4_9BILA|nr:unnamed protein product [Didymodactylos carnosus]CAF3527764.1 unnamed protein product [Didymodactylos carnosus]
MSYTIVRSNKIMPLTLEDLPNELYVFLFNYLKSSDIFRLFSGLNYRFNQLIRRYLRHIDLSRLSDIQLTNYLPLLDAESVHALKLNDNYIEHIFLYRNLNHVTLVNIINEKSKWPQFVAVLKQFDYLKMIFVWDLCDDTDEKCSSIICSNLFHPSCSLKELHLEHIYLTINENRIQPCLLLKRLLIGVRSDKDLHILMNNLPLIEYLKVNLEYGIHHQAHHISSIRRIMTKLKTFHIESLEYCVRSDSLKLILDRCPFVEQLFLNIMLGDRHINCRQIQDELLSLLVNLKEFHFYISFVALIDQHNLETYFSSFNRPIFAYKQHCLFSLPYAFEQLDLVENSIVNCRTTANDLCLYSRQHHLKKIVLGGKTAYSLKLFAFIRDMFPNVQILEFTRYCYLEIDLLNDTNLVFNCLHTLVLPCVYQTTFADVKRLLLLTPNLDTVNIYYDLLLRIKSQLEDDVELYPLCQQLRQLIVFSGFVDKPFLHQQIQSLFPKASVSYT